MSVMVIPIATRRRLQNIQSRCSAAPAEPLTVKVHFFASFPPVKQTVSFFKGKDMEI